MNEHDYLDYGHASFNEYILDVYLRAQDSTVCWGVAVPQFATILPRYVFIKIMYSIYALKQKCPHHIYMFHRGYSWVLNVTAIHDKVADCGVWEHQTTLLKDRMVAAI